MIFVNPETLVAKELFGDNVKHALNLYKFAGADAMVSKLTLPPASENFVRKHIAEDCTLFVILSVQQLRETSVESLLVRLNTMMSLGANHYQCVLLVDNSHNNDLLTYNEYVSKVDDWVYAGGTSMTTMGNTAHYILQKRDERLAETSRVRLLYPNQVKLNIEFANDWRKTIATFPYVGEQGSDYIRKQMLSQSLGDNLLDALYFISDENRLDRPADARWKKVIEAARAYLVLPPGLNLSVDSSEKDQVDNGSSI